MEHSQFMDAYAQAKRINHLLNEILDLSRQLADAVDRDDKVSIQMLLSMRQTPINQVKQADQTLMKLCADLPSPIPDQRFTDGQNFEKTVSLNDQISANQRLLAQVRNLDEAINRKLTRGQSVYH